MTERVLGSPSIRRPRLGLAAAVGVLFAGLGFAAGAGAAAGDAAPPRLSAEQIVQKFTAARGGLQAWHELRAMTWSGRMEVGYADSKSRSARYVSNSFNRSVKAQRVALEQQAAVARREGSKQVELPFVLEMKRPDKSRIELQFAGKTAVQVYDGRSGWLLRPYLNRDDWQPFSAEQAKLQAETGGVDGLLIDHAAKGTKVAFEAVEPVEGSPAYRLRLTLKGGEVRHVWIDAKSFLDVRVEGAPRRMDGKLRTVWVAQRDFRPEQGLMVPHLFETVVDGYADTHRMVVDKVALNPQFDDALFAPPKP